ncbi:hypothetical protein Tco_1245403 [Tanacetum coccineum]
MLACRSVLDISFSGGGRGVGLAYVVEEGDARLEVGGGPLVVVCGGRREVEEGGEPREVVCGGGDEEFLTVGFGSIRLEHPKPFAASRSDEAPLHISSQNCGRLLLPPVLPLRRICFSWRAVVCRVTGRSS